MFVEDTKSNEMPPLDHDSTIEASEGLQALHHAASHCVRTLEVSSPRLLLSGVAKTELESKISKPKISENSFLMLSSRRKALPPQVSMPPSEG